MPPPADYFPFLTHPANLRNRTTFYNTLARLLFMEDTPAKFKSFVAPLQQVRGGGGGSLPVMSRLGVLETL